MGFLGYLHVGITVDRLRQEYGSEVLRPQLLSSLNVETDYRHVSDCPI
jgi:translation elongation factor EF-4